MRLYRVLLIAAILGALAAVVAVGAYRWASEPEPDEPRVIEIDNAGTVNVYQGGGWTR